MADDAIRVVRTVYLCFAAHHVTLHIACPEIAAQIASNFAAMLAPAPVGDCAGIIEVVTHSDGTDRAGNFGPDTVWYTDEASGVRELTHLTIKRLIAARPDLLWIHAGVMALAGRALLLSAPSGQGKSTLVAHLAARGWVYLSDEIAAIDPLRATALPFPVTPYMRAPGPPGLSDAEVRALDKLPVEILHWAPSAINVPLAGVYFLSYRVAGSAVEIAPCPPGSAVVEMLRNSLNTEKPREQEIAGLCRLMSQIPARHLRYAHAKDAAEEIMQAHLVALNEP